MIINCLILKKNNIVINDNNFFFGCKYSYFSDRYAKYLKKVVGIICNDDLKYLSVQKIM